MATCTIERPNEHQFNPYTMHGGSMIAVAGDKFSLIAADTRLSEGFSILDRDVSKIHRISDKLVVGTTGFQGDIVTLMKLVKLRSNMYLHNHRKPISPNALAGMISTMLYGRRFFPYYVYNLVVGLDEAGKGCIYSYDPVGSYERNQYKACGTAFSLLQPLLDNQIGGKHMSGQPPLITLDKALKVVKDAFTSAAERDIYTGDCVEILVITDQGVSEERHFLRRD